MTTPLIRNSISRSSLLHGLLLIMFVLAFVALPPTAQTAPPAGKGPPDGDLGNGNTAEGNRALFSLTTGANNTAMGFDALYSLTSSNGNTALGDHALYTMTDAAMFGFGVNTAIGADSLRNNTTGVFNTATGHAALLSNTTGVRNTADGKGALLLNTNGGFNVATGNAALFNNTTGSKNIALGFFAGDNLTTGDNNIDIANIGVAAEANTIRIGTEVAVTDQVGIAHPAHTATFIAGIYGETTGDLASTTAVVIDMNGNLGTTASSERFKKDIAIMGQASEGILALRPVTFHYKTDGTSTPQFGLIAEEVAKVNPALVLPDKEGKPYTVRYDAVNAMLLNEFLKARRQIDSQQKQIDALTAGLQKVSAQLELNKPAPQVTENDR